MKRTGRRLLFALAAFAVSGCVEAGTPVAPPHAGGGASLAVGVRGRPELADLATFRNPPPVASSATGWIGPEGGRLEFHGFAIDVPAGAVSRPRQFSIRLPVDPFASDRVVAEFGPHGAEFARPVTIELPYAGTSLEGSGGSVLWWNPAWRSWVALGTSLTDDGMRLKALTDHFSLYGAGVLLRSGGVTVSGG